MPIQRLGRLSRLRPGLFSRSWSRSLSGAELGEWGIDGLWPFLVLGAAVPGATSLLFIQAVRTIGPSRAAVLIAMAPLISVVLAIIFLAERPNAALVLGTVLIVVGGLFFAGERLRPEGFRVIGIFLALSSAVLFAARDNVARWATSGEEIPPLVAATAALGAGAAFLLIYLLIVRRKRLGHQSGHVLAAFVPTGILLGAEARSGGGDERCFQVELTKLR